MGNENLRTDGKRLWQSIMDMAEIGPGEAGGSCRLALTDEDKQGRDLFVSWCKEIGCSIAIDDMGNIFARRAGQNGDLSPVVTGSHLDTQPHGGRFDGIYGVLAGLEVLRTLEENNIQTSAPVEVVCWTNEEGSRFAPAMVSSGVFAGLFEKDFAYSRTDVNGLTLLSELERIGYKGEELCGEHPMKALFESHIEQGPILERDKTTVGVVTGGQGQRWYDIVLKGQDSHAGSTPMVGRRDALVAASELIGHVQSIANQFKPHGVGTVGEMHVKPNSRNTIPGEVHLTVDVRHPESDTLVEMDKLLREHCQSIENNHNVLVSVDEIWTKPPVKFDTHCVDAVRSSANDLGYSNLDIVSGAGHDACQVCEIVPTAMIFVPCAGGISHNEEESAEPEDLEAGCNVLLHAILKIANQET